MLSLVFLKEEAVLSQLLWENNLLSMKRREYFIIYWIHGSCRNGLWSGGVRAALLVFYNNLLEQLLYCDLFSQISGIIILCNTVIGWLWWQLTISLIHLYNISPHPSQIFFHRYPTPLELWCTRILTIFCGRFSNYQWRFLRARLLVTRNNLQEHALHSRWGFVNHSHLSQWLCGGFFLLNLMSPLHRLCTEKGLPHYFPGYADVRPAPTVSGVVTSHASAGQRREW